MIRPDGGGGDIDGPAGAQEVRELLLEVGLVVLKFVPDCEAVLDKVSKLGWHV